MRIHNIHHRAFHATRDELAALLDGSDDRLWPHDGWPAMRFDRPLQVGASGGHGFVRYSVDAYDQGQRVVFRFAPDLGLVGTHTFEAHSTGAGHCTLRHVIDARAEGAMRLLWPLAVRPLHDAVAEDALDRAELALHGTLPHPSRWSTRVRVLRRLLARRQIAQPTAQPPNAEPHPPTGGTTG